jgi:hypothetical protein
MVANNAGHDMIICVHVHSFRLGTLGDVTVGGAAPVYPSSFRAHSCQGPSGACLRPAFWMPVTRHIPSGGNTFNTLARGTAAP